MDHRFRSSELNEDASHCTLPHRGKSSAQLWLEFSTKVRCRTILIVSLPELGHLNPVLNLGCELAHRGHKVLLASCNFVEAKIQKRLEDAKIEFLGICDEAPDHNSVWSSLELYVQYNSMMLPGLRRAIAERMPDAILADFMTICAFETEADIPIAVNFADPVLFSMAGPHPSRLAALGTIFMVGFWAAPEVVPFAWKIMESLYCRLCLVNTCWGIQPRTLVPPNIVLTGPTGPRISEETLETPMPELNAWLSEVRGKNLPVVYVTFGSMVQLDAQQVQSIYNGLTAIPGIAVAWSLKEAAQKHLPELPKHVFIHHWFPQAEVVRLRDVVAVVTHCGWGGLMEIVMAGKPVIGVPFFGDQPMNASMAKQQGFGEVVPAERLSAAALTAAARKVLKDPSYSQKAQQAQAFVLASGGAWMGAMHVETLASHGCSQIVRRSPSLWQDLASKTGVAVVIGLACVAVADHLRRIIKDGKN
mmetsp:Transcript_78679/g.138768  ORF Transcript_78679/g.138768 Transcript_78679/m.138768 type:complete len:475 (-) Transcript_78679:30-1454(-)